MSVRPFYFSTIRNLTAAFGSLFDSIYVQRYDNTGKQQDLIKVPLSYAPGDKTIIMLQQRNPQLQNNGVDLKVILPRLAFELTGINYDPTRKTQTVNKVVFPELQPLTFSSAAVNTTTNIINIPNHGVPTGRSVTYTTAGTPIGGLTVGTKYYTVKIDNNNIGLAATADLANASTLIDLTSAGTGIATLTFPFSYMYSAIPYNFEFTVYAFVKYIDDGLQIIEQILPYFTPFFTVTMNDVPAYGVEHKVPISIATIVSEDQYQGDVADDRIITWTLTFSAAGWIYPPVQDSAGLIKTADVNIKDLDFGQTLSTVQVQVNPVTANITDNWTIQTTITENT